MPYRQNVCTYCKIYCDEPFVSCPICGRELEPQYNVNSGYSRYGSSEESFDDDPYSDADSNRNFSPEEKNSPREHTSSRRTSRRHIEGVIHDLAPLDNDDRIIFTRIYDSIRFGTVNSTVGYSFRVSRHNSDEDAEVVCYGVPSSRSAKLVNGAEVRVIGSENRHGIIMARSIHINGKRVKLVNVENEPTPRGRINIVLVLLVLVLLLVGAAYFIPAVRNFIGLLLTMMIVAEIIFIAVRPLRPLAVRPIPIVVVGGILTALMYNVGGISDILGAYIYALAPIAIIIIGIVIMIRSIL